MRYELLYTEIKVKRFNKESSMREFIRNKAHSVIQVIKNTNGIRERIQLERGEK